MASVLHLGNIHFAADEDSNAQVTTENQLKYLTRVSLAGEGMGGALRREAPAPHYVRSILGSSLVWKAQHLGKP